MTAAHAILATLVGILGSSMIADMVELITAAEDGQLHIVKELYQKHLLLQPYFFDEDRGMTPAQLFRH